MQHIRSFNESTKKADKDIFTEINDILIDLRDILPEISLIRSTYNTANNKYSYIIKCTKVIRYSNILKCNEFSNLIGNEYCLVYERLESAGYIITASKFVINYGNRSRPYNENDFRLEIDLGIQLSKGDFKSVL